MEILLWAVVIIAVAILCFMAGRFSRVRMRREAHETSDPASGRGVT